MLQLFIASVFLFSCSDFYRPGQLEKIDVLLIELEEIQDLCDRSELDTIPLIISEVERLEYTIKQNYLDDTLSLAFAKKLDSYQSIRKNLTPLNGIGPALIKTINIERVAIKNLREDVLYCTGDRAMFEYNISFEAESVNDLRQLAQQCISIKESNVETFNNLHGDLRLYSLKLENQNKER